MSTIDTSDMNHAAWLAANGLPFLSADASRPPRVRFVFDDPDARGDRLLGEFVRNEVLISFTVWRGRLAYVLRVLRETRQTTLTADDVDVLRTPRRR